MILYYLDDIFIADTTEIYDERFVYFHPHC
jgi:hypothetical protein